MRPVSAGPLQKRQRLKVKAAEPHRLQFALRIWRRQLSPSNIYRYDSPILSTARKASCGISTLPSFFMRRLPSFCFSSSLRLRVMSPP